MNYKETLDYLYTTLPMFSRMGSAAFKKDLDNIRLLCQELGNPQNSFKSIHIGGTNGKGSVSHMLAAVFQECGYTTGLYTSPHLYDFRERIRVNGDMATQEFVVQFVEKTKTLIEEIQPSFFEITVAMAFDYFARLKVDVAIIEVGLGGRLDSTNIIQPELSIITNIGWDHMNMLGDTLALIAGEKAGIIKSHVPVVIGEKNSETNPVFLHAAEEKNTDIYFAQDMYQPISIEWREDNLWIGLERTADKKTSLYELDLPGIYQKKNLVTVMAARDLLISRGFELSEEGTARALKQVKQITGLHGRWEIIHKQPLVVLEVAHNKEGMQQMLDHLTTLTYRQLHLVLGMVKDKDISTVLKMLPVHARYYFTQADIPRALDANLLQQQASVYSLEGGCYKNVNEALQQAMANANQEDLIIVCGSIFLVAEVNRTLKGQLA